MVRCVIRNAGLIFFTSFEFLGFLLGLSPLVPLDCYDSGTSRPLTNSAPDKLGP